jgi:hypothetical protein
MSIDVTTSYASADEFDDVIYRRPTLDLDEEDLEKLSKRVRLL